MKLQFKSKFEKIAKEFAAHIKAERQLESTIAEKDGSYTVEYSIADYCGEKVSDSCTPCAPTYDDLSRVASYILQEVQYQTNWLYARIAGLENEFYGHVYNGHLPPIQGPEKMAKAISVLGLDGDYEVKKRQVYASTLDIDLPEVKKTA